MVVVLGDAASFVETICWIQHLHFWFIETFVIDKQVKWPWAGKFPCFKVNLSGCDGLEQWHTFNEFNCIQHSNFPRLTSKDIVKEIRMIISCNTFLAPFPTNDVPTDSKFMGSSAARLNVPFVFESIYGIASTCKYSQAVHAINLALPSKYGTKLFVGIITIYHTLFMGDNGRQMWMELITTKMWLGRQFPKSVRWRVYRL